MKQKTITTDKATLLVCELPEGAKFIRIETNQAVVPYGKEINYEVPPTKESYGYEETEGFALPEGNWQLLGSLPDITETQADGSVEKVVFEDEEFEDIIKYRDYTGIPIGKYNKCYAPITALKSLYSLLQANEVCFENPVKLPDYDMKYMTSRWTYYGADILKHREAQEQVWDKERCYIFIKVD